MDRCSSLGKNSRKEIQIGEGHEQNEMLTPIGIVADQPSSQSVRQATYTLP